MKIDLICRVCGAPELHRFLALGSTALANRFLKTVDPDVPEPHYPLNVAVCERCTLVTLEDVVPPEAMFSEYVYVSGTSETMPLHFKKHADALGERFLQGKSSPLVVEAGSNDGTLLLAFAKDVRTVGVEPATNIAEIARNRGVDTRNDFFGEDTARAVRAEHGEAALVLANNVFAHVPSLHDFARGARALLAADGAFVFEASYVLDMLDHLEFDSVYHEHLAYFSVTMLKTLFEANQMEIFDVQHVPTHGGSLRVFVQHRHGPHATTPAVNEFLQSEVSRGVRDVATYLAFGERVLRLRDELRTLLRQLKADGKRIVAYGAAAKGNTLASYVGMDTSVLDFVVDKNPLKQGLFTPGTHIPVYGAERLVADQPDYAVIFAWNFAEEIMAQQKEYLARGGRFIVPMPTPRIVGA